MIRAGKAMNISLCAEKIAVYSGVLDTIWMKDCCHALGIFFKLNEDHFILQTDLNVKNLHVA